MMHDCNYGSFCKCHYGTMGDVIRALSDTMESRLLHLNFLHFFGYVGQVYHLCPYLNEEKNKPLSNNLYFVFFSMNKNIFTLEYKLLATCYSQIQV